MNKTLKVLALSAAMLALTACGNSTVKTTEVKAPAEVTMENLDQVIDHTTVIDLRNLEDKFGAGYIKNTELVPFFQVLEAQGVVARGTDENGNKVWNAELAAVDTNFNFGAVFPRDEVIVMFCVGGTRAGFMKDVLVSQGYDADMIHNAGAFRNYSGEYHVPATIDFE